MQRGCKLHNRHIGDAMQLGGCKLEGASRAMARFRGHPDIRALGLRRCQVPWPGCAKRPALGREPLSEGGRGGLATTSESEPCRALQVGPGLTRGSGRRVRALPRHARHDAVLRGCNRTRVDFGPHWARQANAACALYVWPWQRTRHSVAPLRNLIMINAPAYCCRNDASRLATLAATGVSEPSSKKRSPKLVQATSAPNRPLSCSQYLSLAPAPPPDAQF
jgi:hypothetical protein